MDKVYVFLATGFEELETIAPIDIFRRAGIDIKTVSVKDTRYVDSTHGVTIKADLIFRETDFDNASMLILPGGMPGADELAACYRLGKALQTHHENGGLIGAICAAPMVLGKLGILKGLRATCYPGFEVHLEGAIYVPDQPVVTSRNITTAYGPGAAFDFGFTLLSQLVDSRVVETIKNGMMVKK